MGEYLNKGLAVWGQTAVDQIFDHTQKRRTELSQKRDAATDPDIKKGLNELEQRLFRFEIELFVTLQSMHRAEGSDRQ